MTPGGALQAILRLISAEGVLWAAVSALQNVVAILVLLAVGYAFVRRLITRPRRLAYTRGALIILGLIGGVVATELLAQAFEAARFGSIPGAFLADALAVPLGSLTPGILLGVFGVLWWAHIVIVAAFLGYLPSSKHLHIATAFFNVYFRKLAPRGELPAMDLEAVDASFGLRTLQDLGWKDLLDGFTCTECGRCTDACPANMTGKPLNPREMIMGLRHHGGRRRTGSRPHPELADHPRAGGLRRHDAQPRLARHGDRRSRDSVRRRLGLRDLRRVR